MATGMAMVLLPLLLLLVIMDSLPTITMMTLILLLPPPWKASILDWIYWRRQSLCHFLYHLLWLVELWEIQKLLLLLQQEQQWQELWKMLSCRIFHLTLNCAVLCAEMNVDDLLLFFASFPPHSRTNAPSLSLTDNFPQFHLSIFILKNSYSMFIHPAHRTQQQQ